jgi:hypothetical protein
MFRFLITSRAEFDINAALADLPNIVSHELSITTESNANDISFFLRNELVAIRHRHRAFGLVKLLSVNWSDAQLVWASLAANFIAKGYDPDEQVKVLLHAGSYGSAEAALDALYVTALHAAGKWDSDAFF